MKQNEKTLASVGLLIGAVFGASGSIFTDPPVLQTMLYEISSIGLTAGTAFLAVKFMRDNKDYIATGFLLFAIAEAIMTVGMPLGQVGGQPSFGAGLAMYVPGLLLISIPKGFPLLFRITGTVACVPFAVAAAKIFMGEQVLSTTPIPGAAYGLLTITIFGWVWSILKGKVLE